MFSDLDWVPAFVIDRSNPVITIEADAGPNQNNSTPEDKMSPLTPSILNLEPQEESNELSNAAHFVRKPTVNMSQYSQVQDREQ